MVAVSGEDGWQADLARRLARVGPEHTIRGLFLQSYLRQLRALGGEALERNGLALCGSAPLVELFHYPVRTQLQLLGLLMPPLVARHGTVAEGLRALGRACIGDFLSSYTGRFLVRLAGTEARRMLNHAPMGYRVATGSGEHTLEWRGPRHCHWTMRGIFLPCAYHEGQLAAILERGGAREVRLHGRQTDLLDSTYDITWD